jgi:hypothetical protein
MSNFILKVQLAIVVVAGVIGWAVGALQLAQI